MKVAIDISPLKKGNFLLHRVRGTGLYLENLKNSLLKYYPNNQYIFFTREEKLPKDIDLVHFPYFEPFFLTLPILKQHKTVITIHDLTPLVFPKNFPAGIRGRIKWFIQKSSVRNASAVITDSFSSKKDIIKYVGIKQDKVNVVYLAAGGEFREMENGKREEEVKLKYNLPEKFVLYVGDVTWNKNLPRLIEAVKNINVPLVMVGKALTEESFDKNNPWNQDRVKIQKLIENDKNIFCLGFIPTDDLVMIYNLAAVFAMPSLYEGFGLPILEAMNCGCPVITSREGSVSEIAKNSVLYVDPHNVDSIGEGIKRLCSDSNLRQELSKKGIIRSKEFSWKKVARDTMGVYDRVILLR